MLYHFTSYEFSVSFVIDMHNYVNISLKTDCQSLQC